MMRERSSRTRQGRRADRRSPARWARATSPSADRPPSDPGVATVVAGGVRIWVEGNDRPIPLDQKHDLDRTRARTVPRRPAGGARRPRHIAGPGAELEEIGRPTIGSRRPSHAIRSCRRRGWPLSHRASRHPHRSAQRPARSGTSGRCCPSSGSCRWPNRAESDVVVLGFLEDGGSPPGRGDGRRCCSAQCPVRLVTATLVLAGPTQAVSRADA